MICVHNYHLCTLKFTSVKDYTRIEIDRRIERIEKTIKRTEAAIGKSC